MSREPEDIHAALAALADDTLPEQEREPLLARLGASPELTAELGHQRRAVALVRSLERVEAPALLRRSLELAATGEPQSAGAGRAGIRFRRPRLALGATLAAAVAAVGVLVLVLASAGGSSAPTVLQASRVGLRAPILPAPRESSRDPHVLAVSIAGIHYPYWGGKLGWNAVGARTDTVQGRTITTVFYADRVGRRIGYSIVAGGALATRGGTVTERSGVSFRVLRAAAPTIVTWREGGHTCILTARGVSAGKLTRLATWQRA